MTSLALARTNLEAVLAADTPLNDWAQTYFNKPWTAIKSNKPISRIDPSEYPVRVYEIDDGDTGPEIGAVCQNVVTKIKVAMAWHEESYDTAFDQRTELVDLVIKAVMRNPTLSISGQRAVLAGWVSRFVPDNAANHPKHFLNFEISIEYEVKP